MKRAKVSAVYEGRRRKRGRGGGGDQEAGSDSRMARSTARARKYLWIPYIMGYNNSSFTSPQKTKMTRSMVRSMQFMDTKNVAVNHVHHHKQPVGLNVAEEKKSESNQNYVGARVVVDQPRMEVMTNAVVPSEPTVDSSPGAINNIALEPESVAKKPIFDASFARMDDMEGGGYEWWEEWPFRLSYEEDWMCTETDSRPNWEVMSGDMGAPLGVDDLWNFGDMNDVPMSN